MIQMTIPPLYIYVSNGSQSNQSLHNNNNNSGILWETIIKIWGLHGHNNNSKGDTLTITICGIH